MQRKETQSFSSVVEMSSSRPSSWLSTLVKHYPLSPLSGFETNLPLTFKSQSSVRLAIEFTLTEHTVSEKLQEEFATMMPKNGFVLRPKEYVA